MIDDLQRTHALLRRLPWLKQNAPESAETLAAEGMLSRFDVGQWLQSEGDEETGVAIIVVGAIDLYSKAPGDRVVLIGQYGAGLAFGQSMLFGAGPRLLSAVCAEPSLVLRLSDAKLDSVARTRPELRRALTALHYQNMQMAIRVAVEVIALPPRQRLASRLVALTRGRVVQSVLTLKQQDLAEMIGVTRKTVNRCLAEFQRNGLVTIEYGRIRLNDLKALERVANS